MCGVEIFKGLDVIFVFGGFGYCGVEGMIMIVCFVCENNIFYLGICLGMQVVLIDYVCYVVNMENVNFMEFVLDCKYLVVVLIIEWCDENGNVEVCSEKSDFGGIMCFGVQQCQLVDDSLVCQLYNVLIIVECYCYCYEVNNMLLKQIEDVGLCVVGCFGDDQLVEIIEVLNYLWFVVCQFYLEFIFILCDGYLLFVGFVKVVSEFQKCQVK